MAAIDPSPVLDTGGLVLPEGAEVTLCGSDPILGSRHHVGEAAAAAIASTAAWAARFAMLRGLPAQSVEVEVRAAAASLIGFVLQDAQGADVARAFSPATDLFGTADDRLIHLHGGFPHLERGVLELLGCRAETRDIRAAVATWGATDLEAALADAGLCGAVVRSEDEWRAHPQGSQVVDLPAVRSTPIGDAASRVPTPAARPLAGIRVLDLTRVLAGPTAGRTLASHGADVLRVDGPDTPCVESFELETSWGKRRAVCDLSDPGERDRLMELVEQADVVVQGYRPGALERHGLAAADLMARRPGLIVARINCYGPDGPWSTRRGWEQLAQSVSGLAVAENPAQPTLIAAAATDYTTGYVIAAAVAHALCRQVEVGGSWLLEGSLCQTAAWLIRLGSDLDPSSAAGLGEVSALQETADCGWGPVTHLAPAGSMSVTSPRWVDPAARRGSSPLRWDGRSTHATTRTHPRTRRYPT